MKRTTTTHQNTATHTLSREHLGATRGGFQRTKTETPTDRRDDAQVDIGGR